MSARPVSARRRPRALALALAALTLFATSCSSGEDAGEDAQKLTIFAAQGPDTDLASNSFSKEMEKLTGTTFDWQTTTWDGTTAAEARRIQLAGGDYPEVFLMVPWVDQFSQQDLLRYGQQGVLQPLNDLIEKNAPNIKATFAENPDYAKLATAPDGKIWGLPQWNDCYHCSYQAKLWINTDWLDKLGLKMPTTTDEFYDVMVAFKTKDPNGNGQADEIPLTSSVDDLLLPYFVNAFLYDPQGSGTYPSTLALEDGKVTLQARQDAYRKALAFMAKMYAAGLIDPAAFTQNRDALVAKGDNAEAPLVGAATALHPNIFVTTGQDDGRDKAYQALPPLKGPDGVQFASYNLPSMPGATFALTNKASEDEQVAAIKMIDYMFPQDQHARAEFGIEGKDWFKPEPGEKALDDELTPFARVPEADPNVKPANDGWGPLAQYNSNADFRNGQVQPADGYERKLFEASKLYEPYVPQDQVFPYWSVWVPQEESAEVAELTTNIQNLVSQASAEFVTGTRDVNDDAAWTSYVDELDSTGLSRYLQIEQKAYDATK
ncbi:extracellular solute-binding protein [Kineococcus rhizosphaerae]|uniref:Putative aldouronate transport system substrate-binding protein n=1 Tax=Kineococcus rhizosphaerae TaxID=559628 RepID=A0A2T0QY78_9ACTN|nr:extracellular solute-binding protein [Kineococcus rhizosphaerae]PRY11078.1 putative aldouronate transport system substrate-binding protein [Kineococcus rhizosphaerae]